MSKYKGEGNIFRGVDRDQSIYSLIGNGKESGFILRDIGNFSSRNLDF